jgi:hypothetical protein
MFYAYTKSGRSMVAATGTGGERELHRGGRCDGDREVSGSCSLDFLLTFSSWKKQDIRYIQYAPSIKTRLRSSIAAKEKEREYFH